MKPVPVAVSLGCGIDSSAMTLMAANGDPRLQGVEVVASYHSDMQAEMPETYQFYQDYLFPYLEEQGAPRPKVLTPQVTDRNGETHSNLYEYYYAQACVPSRSRRSCTDRFKISVVNARIAETWGDDIPVLIGFDCHELRRADGLAQFSDRYRFPLVEAGIDRLEAAAILLRAGLPVPRRSACFCCPFSRVADWWEMRRRHPYLYAKAQELEDHVLQERGRDYPLGYKPLRERHDPRPKKKAMTDEAVALFKLAQSYLGRISPAWPSHALCLAAREIYGLWWVDALRNLDLGQHTPRDPWQIYVRIEYSLELSGCLPVAATLPCGAWQMAAPVALPSAGKVGQIL